jgi:SAM-dependent methyltransferase
VAITVNAIHTFLIEANRRPLSGALLTLGRQDILATPEQMLEAFGRYDVTPVEVPDGIPLLSAKPGREGMVNDVYFFRALGFTEVVSSDASPYENADTMLDLNHRDAWKAHAGRFDFIFDGGTIEHVFHVPNSLANIGNMLKEGGRVYHLSPSSNYIDHGFYMFSPTLFWDYYSANRYDLNTLQVFRYHRSEIY